MHQFYSHLYIIVQTTLDILCKSVIFNGLCIIFFAAIYIIIHLNICTSKTPTLSADLSDKGNSYHALEKCEGVKNDDITVTESTIITKIDVNDSDLESDSEKSVSKNNEAFRELFNPDTKDSYKKMDIRALRRLVVTRGLATENTARMKKNELIDMLLTIV